jgi:hypothetical protein
MVCVSIHVRLVVSDDTKVPLRATLSYDLSDPFAVRVMFHTAPHEHVEWVFARELLYLGSIRHTGDGDVRVWPACEDDGNDAGETMLLALSSPYGRALFEMPLADVVDFLGHTYSAAPAGDESNLIDVDEELRTLLGTHET